MDETLQDVQESVIRGIGELTDFFGFSPVMGHLYAALLMNPEALSLDELEEIVGKSKASVSMNMRALERWGMVREVWVKGDRRKFYEAESDLWKIVRSVIGSRELREVGVALQVLDENAKTLKATRGQLSQEEQELADYYLARVNDMQSLFHFAQLVLELFIKLGTPPSLDKFASFFSSFQAEPEEESAAD
jgi:DNA-binding transcriptional regulator GbsR (MarR family)